MTEPGDRSVDRLRLAKQSIRKQILAARAALDPAERVRLSAAISDSLIELPELQRARCALAYLSFGHEFSTERLIAWLDARGCTLVLPRIDRAAHRLELYHVHDPVVDTLSGVWGIREPDPTRCAPAAIDAIDVIIVPGVAFTLAGDRLGYGGGYYDELLARWQRPPPRIAAAFDLQIVGELPTTVLDQPVDVIVTQSVQFRRPEP
jgi:5-formyltetrahydrofolate cyclo-ligase